MVSAAATILLVALLFICLSILYLRRNETELGGYVCYIAGVQLVVVAIILLLLAYGAE